MDERIIQYIQEACALNEKVHPKMAFTEISIDSISFIELIVRLEDELNIFIDDEELDVRKYPTIDDFIKVVKEKIKSDKN